jgi:hypothetical protein
MKSYKRLSGRHRHAWLCDVNDASSWERITEVQAALQAPIADPKAEEITWVTERLKCLRGQVDAY